MINREDAIDNLKINLKGLGSQYIEDYREDIEFAINDMQDMQKIRKQMLKDEKLERIIDQILKA